jgi:replicative DNA helicase
MRNTPTNWYWTPSDNATIDVLINRWTMVINRRRDTGVNVQVMMLDYVQLIKNGANDPRQRTLSDIVNLLKAFAEETNIVLWCATQVTKSSARDSRDGRILDETSAQYIRADEANLALSLMMNYYPADYSSPDGQDLAGRHDNTAVLAVVKNSGGRNGYVIVPTLLDNLTWIDREINRLPHHPERFRMS